MSPTPKQVCSVSGIKWRTSPLSGWIRPKTCQKKLVLKVQIFHGSVDNRGTGIRFLLKNQRNTTKDQLASPFGSFLTQLQEWFSSDNQCIALGQSLVPKCVEGHSTVFRAHKEIGRTTPQNLDMEMLCWGAKWDNHKGKVSKRPANTILQCDSNSFPTLPHCAEDCLHPSCYQLLL